MFWKIRKFKSTMKKEVEITHNLTLQRPKIIIYGTWGYFYFIFLTYCSPFKIRVIIYHTLEMTSTTKV